MLCRLPVAKDRRAPHPLAPTLDHIRPQVLGGGHETDNLQTAHLRCNESKHMRPDRGSNLRVVIEPGPEVLELLRRIAPESNEALGRELPELSADTIGDVFDQAVESAKTEQLCDLPTADQLRAWVVDQVFLNKSEADSALVSQMFACLDERGQHERLRHRLMEQQPHSWFIAEFLMEGAGPQALEDEDGWDDVAQALLSYIGYEQLEDLRARALDGLFEESPLEVLDRLPEPVLPDDDPGLYRGHPIWAYEDAIRALKAADRLPECEKLLLGLIDALEAKVASEGGSLSPYLFEQLAIVRRKMGDDSGELEILNRYFAQPGALDSSRLLDRLAKVKHRLAG